MSDAIAIGAPLAGLLVALDTVPDPVFADGMMGAGFAIDPTEGVVHSPAAATVVNVPASGHAITLRLDNGVELLIHIGLETVALGGRGFEAKVRTGDRVAAGETLIAFDLDEVARGARDLVTPIVVPSGGTLSVGSVGRLVAAGDVIAHATADPDIDCSETIGATAARDIQVTAPHGIHARPAARIVALLKRFDAAVTLGHGEREASGASTVAMLALGARYGDMLTATAHGRDAAAALDALAEFAAARFGDAVSDGPAKAARPSHAGGVCASPGLAIGQIHRLRPTRVEVREAGAGIAAETHALEDALRGSTKASARAGPAAAIVEAHDAIREDPMLRDRALAAIGSGKSAGAAWRLAIDEAASALAHTGDPRLIERIADLRDVEREVLVALGGKEEASPEIPPRTILVAEDLLPSQFLALDQANLAGICTAAGGPTAHVTILAAAAGIPMVVAAGSGVLAHADGVDAILDADAGRLAVDPDRQEIEAAKARIATRRFDHEAETRAAHLPAITADGHRIEVFANLGSLQDAEEAVAAGAEGCGLLRTEFLFLDRDTPPGEQEQRTIYADIASALGGRPLIVRTLDIGGDKPVPYLPSVHEENPALGQRGIRLSLARPDLLAEQLRAIVAGVPSDQCRIMLPMVVEPAEVIAVRAMLDEAMAAIGRADPVQLGVMIETPAAAMLAKEIAAEADFLSVGTNDLTQYALAADRANADVSAMVDALHPAVLRLIRVAAQGAAAHERWFGVCGGLASDPRAAALLIGLGVTELSAVPTAVPSVKAAVARVTMSEARDLAEAALRMGSAADVRALIGATR